jgi:hypothetical protein
MSSVRPVVLRNGVGIEDPVQVVLGFLKASGRFDVSDLPILSARAAA